MNMKTLTGPSIHAALAEARHLLGDDVVLIESVAAEDGRPARVTVMVDTPAPPVPAAAAVQPAPSPRPVTAPQAAPVAVRQPVPELAGSSPASSAPFGYAAQSNLRSTPPGAENAARPASEEPASRATRPAPFEHMMRGEVDRSMNLAAPRTGGRGRLFDAADAGTALPYMAAYVQHLEAHLERLHQRLDDMEQRFGSALVGSAHRWTAHPLFKHLLNQGFQPDTITRQFNLLAERGLGPNAPADQLLWALAHALRDQFASFDGRHTASSLMVVGPGGSGKTSLLLKLAKHPLFFGRRRVAVLVIRPEDDRAVGYQDATDLYRRFGLPVQNISQPSDMRPALKRIQAFDQVLVDTPSLPFDALAARRMLSRLEYIIEPLMPLQVHYVLNATSALHALDAAYFKRLALRPDAVALTHLDESAGWGYAAEWLLRMQWPVQYVSVGPGVPDDTVAFSPSWFVEHVMPA